MRSPSKCCFQNILVTLNCDLSTLKFDTLVTGHFGQKTFRPSVLSVPTFRRSDAEVSRITNFGAEVP